MIVLTGFSVLGQQSRPEGAVKPEAKELLAACDFLAKAKADDTLKALSDFKPKGDIEEAWLHYLKGSAHFTKGALEEGLQEFTIPYTKLKERGSDYENKDVYRVVANCLKKIGFYHRNKGDSEKAFYWHSVEYKYFEVYGSHYEIHDAALSLDADAFDLGEMKISEMWLRTGIETAEKIKDEKLRSMCLGMAWNNISGTLYRLKKFEESESAALKSLGFWQAYEKLGGTGEFRVVWAHYCVADAYHNWAMHLKSKGGDCKPKVEKALEWFEKCLKLARDAKMPDEEIKEIEAKIAEVGKLR